MAEQNWKISLNLCGLLRKPEVCINYVKLCQNKKCQKFVGMLVFEFESAACCKKKKKKDSKKRASQKKFGPSYFVMALITSGSNLISVMV